MSNQANGAFTRRVLAELDKVLDGLADSNVGVDPEILDHIGRNADGSKRDRPGVGQ